MEKLLLQLCLLFSLTACGGSGGTDTAEPAQPQPQPVQTITPTAVVQEVKDKRPTYSEYFYDAYLDFGDGALEYTAVTLRRGEYVDPATLPSNRFFDTVDYNFLEMEVEGVQRGFREVGNPETAAIGPWEVGFNNFFHATDLNDDGHQDFLAAVYFWGTPTETPEQRLFAMINDGEGHFALSTSAFDNFDFNCLGGGVNDVFKAKEMNKFPDPTRACGHTLGHQRMYFADFNNDGKDDVFQTSKLILSSFQGLYDASISNLPEFLFEEGNPVFAHGAATGDFNGDGNVDIFLPAQTHEWHILENDGTGSFTARTTYSMGMLPLQCASNCTEMVWATGAAAGDLNNDGYDEIIAGWYNPYEAREETVGVPTVANSVGVVYVNSGAGSRPQDQFDTVISLPANFYGANGNVNDMVVFDFDNDGYKDIVIATTKHDPYYDGRAIQFLKTVVNGNEITFEDVTAQYNPDVSRYKDGSRIDPAWWNGEGRMRVLDFDGDGDLDIVDSNRETYVLINKGDRFEVFDDIPRTSGNNFGEFYPIDVNGDKQYDFISSDFTKTATTYTKHHFISLAK